MKTLALLCCASGLLLAQNREGNFVIRFEPQAVLQANAEIPFGIHVTDDLHQPILNARVTLQIETSKNTNVTIFKAPQVEPGVFVAKPVFPSAGHWIVYVEVRRGGELSARSIEYDVPTTAQ